MKGLKTGGRRKGSKNIPHPRGGLVAEACNRIGANPFEELARLVKNRNNPNHARAVFEACGYLAPKLKAVEHSGPGGGPIEHDISPRELLARKIAELTPQPSADPGEPDIPAV